MDTRRAGLLLILLCGSSLVVWNLRTIDSSVGQESPELMSESKDGFDKLAPGQSMAYESMSSAMKKMLEPLTDVVVLRTWAAPNWLHVVSGSGKDRATRELRTRKLRECPLTLLMQWVLDEGCVEHHSMVIDIGMNLGWFTALAAANGLQVVAFEPSPARIQYMAKTLELNGWTSVQLRQGALANEVGQLFVDEARWWEKRSASREGGHGKTQAEALRLDDVVPANTKVNVAEQRRRQAALAEYARKVKLGKIIRTYDTNNSGKLERDQVVKLLTDMDSSTPPGTLPSDEQVDFLLKLYDKAGDQAIVIDELEELLICWHTYTENRALFEDKLNKYDVSKTGKLSKEELKAYLTDLNGGIEVQDSEVDWVMQEGDILGDGQLNKMELWRVTALWFSYVDSKKSNDCCTLL